GRERRGGERELGSGMETAEDALCGKEADQFAFRQAYGGETPRWVGEIPAVLDRVKLQGCPEIVDQGSQIVLHSTRTALDHAREIGFGGVSSPLNLSAQAVQPLVCIQMHPSWGTCG